MQKTYRLSEALFFCGNIADFAREFHGETVVVYRLSLSDWLVYKPNPKTPCYELTILPDDDGGYGERFVVPTNPLTTPVNGWGVWNGDRFTEVYVPYNGNPDAKTVWIRLSPDDLDFYTEAQKEVSLCRHKL